MPDAQQNGNDLNTDANLKRIGDLESFKKEYEGKEFDKKVLLSIQDSHTIREEVRGIIAKTLKDKFNWVAYTLCGLVLTDLILRAIPHIFKLIAGN